MRVEIGIPLETEPYGALDCSKAANRKGGFVADPTKFLVTCSKDGSLKYLLEPAFIEGTIERPEGMRGASEPFAKYLSRAVALRTGATWGLGEAGAAGPPNRYGDPAGHVWLSIAGPHAPGDDYTEFVTRHLLTGLDDALSKLS